MNIFSLIRIIVAFSIVGIILYKVFWKKETSLASLIHEAKSFTNINNQKGEESDSIGPIGTFGMS